MKSSEIIEKVKVYTGLSYPKLAMAIGIKTPQTFYDIKKNKCKISKELAFKIAHKFPNISLEWLMTGEGEMLRHEAGNGAIVTGNISGIGNVLNPNNSPVSISLDSLDPDTDPAQLKTQILLLEQQVDALKAQLNAKQETIDSLQAQIDSLQAQIALLRSLTHL